VRAAEGSRGQLQKVQ